MKFITEIWEHTTSLKEEEILLPVELIISYKYRTAFLSVALIKINNK